jgi:hypothetical protein
MPLARQYVSSTIQQINETSFVLTINFVWYSLWPFTEVFTFSTLEEAKKKLIAERSGLMGYTSATGEFIPL